MLANLENSAVATTLEKVCFYPSPKEGECQRMLKLLHSCTHFTCQQGNAQIPSSQASTVHEMRISRCTSWIQKRQRNQRPNCQHQLDHRKSKGIPEKHLLLFIDFSKPFDCVDENKLWKILTEKRIPNHLTCFLRNLHAGQEAAIRTGHGMTDWFQIGKEYVKVVYCHPAYLTYMQSTSCKMLGWMKFRL